MTDDLTHRLRDEEQRHGFPALLATAREAADRIDELERALFIAQGSADKAFSRINDLEERLSKISALVEDFERAIYGRKAND